MPASRRILVPLVAATALALGLAPPAFAGKTLDAVKARGEVVCGVNTSGPGFSAADSQGTLDRAGRRHLPRRRRRRAGRRRARSSACRSTRSSASPRCSRARSTSCRATRTWTLTRDASLGMNFTGITYYDGQGFMVPKKLKIKSAKQLKGATVCVQSGTTTEKNLTDYFARQRPEVQAGGVRHSRGDHRRRTSPAAARPTRPTCSGLAGVRNKDAQARRPRDPARADLEGAARAGGAPRRRRVVRDRQVGAVRA